MKTKLAVKSQFSWESMVNWWWKSHQCESCLRKFFQKKSYVLKTALTLLLPPLISLVNLFRTNYETALCVLFCKKSVRKNFIIKMETKRISYLRKKVRCTHSSSVISMKIIAMKNSLGEKKMWIPYFFMIK